ncbi:hypothetical protein EH30_12915 [Erythrobacter sp. JL475]|nr:hypothetical protein EH30_12915 [Erythrobacter sp. JL475]
MINNANALANVEKAKSLKELKNIISNAKADLASGEDADTAKKVHDAAVVRYWEMSASKHEAGAEVDRALWTALHAYEYLKSEERGKRSRANYLRRKIDQTDIVTAASGSVLKGGSTSGLQTLRDMGRLDISFEAIVLQYETAFAPEVVAAARKTLAELG